MVQTYKGKKLAGEVTRMIDSPGGSLTSRLSVDSQREERGEVKCVPKETTRVPLRKRHEYTPFGVVLDELLESRCMSQTELGIRVGTITHHWSDPRAAIAKTFVQGKGITFHLCMAISQAMNLSPEEKARLLQGAEDTKGL